MDKIILISLNWELIFLSLVLLRTIEALDILWIISTCFFLFIFRMGCTLHDHGHGHSHGGGGSIDHKHSHEVSEQENINVRAAFIHVVSDFVQSCGVFIAAIVIYFKPEWDIIDPICTFLFSVLVLITTLSIMKDALLVSILCCTICQTFNDFLIIFSKIALNFFCLKPYFI